MLRATFTEEMKTAMKAGDKDRLAAIRLIISEMKNKDVDARGAGKAEAGEEDILAMLQKMIKQRADSIEQYRAGGREDLAAKEQGEIDVIRSFLPAQMDAAAIEAAIRDAIAETGAASMKDMGKVVAALRTKYAGRMDFGQASGMVKAALGG
jgi:uncharacterized protein YqeY